MWDSCFSFVFICYFASIFFGSPMKVTIDTRSPCLVILLLLLLGFKQTVWDVMRTYGNMEKHVEFEKLLSGIQWHIVGISSCKLCCSTILWKCLIGSLQLKNLSIVSMHLGESVIIQQLFTWNFVSTKTSFSTSASYKFIYPPKNNIPPSKSKCILLQVGALQRHLFCFLFGVSVWNHFLAGQLFAVGCA